MRGSKSSRIREPCGGVVDDEEDDAWRASSSSGPEDDPRKVLLYDGDGKESTNGMVALPLRFRFRPERVAVARKDAWRGRERFAVPRAETGDEQQRRTA